MLVLRGCSKFSFAVGLALCALLFSAGCGDDPGSRKPDADAGPSDVSDVGDVGGDVGDTGDTGDVGVEDCVSPRFECGESCCTPPEICVGGATCCTPQCEGRQCGSDGCGGECGTCTGGLFCNEESGQCQEQCVESNLAFCKRLKIACGRGVGEDLCGLPRDTECPNTCGPHDICSEQGTCVCVGQPESELCALAKDRLAVECGTGTVKDWCGAERAFDCGDPCEAPKTCEENVCACINETDEALCAAHNQTCGPLRTRDHCGQVREVADCSKGAGCGTNQLCVLGVCQSNQAPVPNDTCGEGVAPIELVDGVGMVLADTTRARGEQIGLCQPLEIPPYDSGLDVVYSFNLAKPSRVTVTADQLGAKTKPALYLRADCVAQGSELGCASTDLHEPLTLEGAVAGPGTIYLWVDSYMRTSAGAQRIVVTAEELEPVLGDACADAIPLAQASGSFDVEVSTIGALPSTPFAACHSSTQVERSSPDVFYVLEIEQDTAFRATLQPGATPSVQPVISLLKGCAGGVEDRHSCSARAKRTDYSTDADDQTQDPYVQYGWAKAGERYIIRLSGMFERPYDATLKVAFFPPVTNDDCSDVPKAIVLAADGSPTVERGDTTFARADLVGNCQNDTLGRDVVYAVTMPPGGKRNLELLLEPAPGSIDEGKSYRPYVYLRESCADSEPAREHSCDYRAYAGSVHKKIFGLTGGATYSLIVDTSGGYWGPFTLTLSSPVGAAEGNALCSAAETGSAYFIDLSSGHAKVEGRTAGASASNPECGGSFANTTGAEVYYRFTLATKSFVRALATQTDGLGYSPSVYFIDSCGAAVASDACGVGAGGTAQVAKLLDPGAGPRDFFVVVDGAHEGEGAFSLELFAHAEYTAGACDAASMGTIQPADAKQISVKIKGDTSAGFGSGSNYATSIGCITTTSTPTGKELAWKLVLPTIASPKLWSIRAKVTPAVGSQLKPILMMRNDCAATAPISVQRTCALSATPASVQIELVRFASSGTFYLIVDSNGVTGADGPFELDVELERSDVPAHDVCSGAKLLTFDGDATTLTVEENTRDAKPDTTVSALCAPSSAGADLVYKLNVGPTLHDLYVTLKPAEGSALAPVLYSSDICGGTYRACTSAPAGKDAVMLLSGRKNDVFIFVDSATVAQEGAFTLSVSRSLSPPPPANDVCGTNGLTAKVLTLPSPQGAVVISDESTDLALDDYSGSCATASNPHDGPDLVYSVQVGSAGVLSARVLRSAYAPYYRPAVYIRDANCESTASLDEVACGADVNGTGVAVASGSVKAGTYYVVVDGVGTSFGRFSLQVAFEQAPLLPDSCTSAERLYLEEALDGRLVFEGDTGRATDNGTSLLKPNDGNGPDLVYTFELTEPKRLKAELAFASIDGMALLYLRKDDCSTTDSAKELAASSVDKGGPASFELNLGAGTYFLWVDSKSPLRGTFQVRLQTSAVTTPAPVTTCAQAIVAQPVQFVGGKAEIKGSTFGRSAGSFAANACLPAGLPGPEAIYRVRIPQGNRYMLTAELTPAATVAPAFQPALYIRTSCADETSEKQVACATTASSGTTLRATIASTADSSAGALDYFVIVDSKAAGGDDFVLKLSLEAAVENACESVNNVVVLNSSNRSAVLSGSTSVSGSNKFNYKCAQDGGAAAGNDLLFLVRVDPGINAFDLVVRNRFATASATNALFLQPDTCTAGLNPSVSSPAAWVCDAPGNVGRAGISTSIPSGSERSYYLWVDGPSSSGAFELTLELVAAGTGGAASSCAAPRALTFANGVATVESDNFFEGDKTILHTACNLSGTGRQEIYALPVTVDSRATVVVIPQGGQVYPTLEIRKTCDAPGTDASACDGAANGSYAVALSVQLAQQANPYYLVVDSNGTNRAGPYKMYVTLEASSGEAARTCASPAPTVTLGATAKATLAGTLPAFGGTETGSCGSMVGGEVAYPITLDLAPGAKTSLSLMLYGNGGTQSTSTFTGYTPSFYLRRGACNGAAAQELGCTYQTSNTVATAAATFTDLEAGDYWLFLDAHTQIASRRRAFMLFLSTDASVTSAENSLCGGATDIELDALGAGSITESSGLKYSTHKMAGVGTCATAPGPERIYKVEVPAGHTLSVKATVTAGSSFTPVVYVRSSCESAAAADQVACVASGDSWSTPFLSAETRTYYVVVDAKESGASGGYKLDVRTAPSTAFAANDSCQSPFPSSAVINLYAANGATVAGSLNDASDNMSASCGGAGAPDKVYRFTLYDPARVRISAYGSGFRPTIYVKSPCDERGSEVSRGACAKGVDGYPSATLDLSYLNAGDYFLWVDGESASSAGFFWVDMELLPAGEPPYRADCFAPKALTWSDPDHATATERFTLTSAEGSNSGTCAVMPGPEFVYLLNLGARQEPLKATIKVIGTYSPETARPYIYLRSVCSDTGANAEWGCVKALDGEHTLVHAALSPVLYYIYVDFAELNAAGDFTLDVAIEEGIEAPVNDRCENASPLSLGDEIEASTASANNDHAAGRTTASGTGCPTSNDWGRGKELVYAYTAESTVGFKVTLTAAWEATLWIDTSCEDNWSCVAGARVNSVAGSTASATVTVAAPEVGKTYYLFVDANSETAAGNFRLELQEVVP